MPELAEYLEQFPKRPLVGVDSSLRWSVVDFGLKPSITISQVAAYSREVDNVDSHVVVSKQIYSSRYLDASLSITALLRVVGAEGPETYLIFADRSRSDALEGALGSFARNAVQKESAKRIKSLLERSQLRLLALAKPSLDPELETAPAGIVDTISSFASSRLGLVAIAALLILMLMILLRRVRPHLRERP